MAKLSHISVIFILLTIIHPSQGSSSANDQIRNNSSTLSNEENSTTPTKSKSSSSTKTLLPVTTVSPAKGYYDPDSRTFHTEPPPSQRECGTPPFRNTTNQDHQHPPFHATWSRGWEEWMRELIDELCELLPSWSESFNPAKVWMGEISGFGFAGWTLCYGIIVLGSWGTGLEAWAAFSVPVAVCMLWRIFLYSWSLLIGEGYLE